MLDASTRAAMSIIAGATPVPSFFCIAITDVLYVGGRAYLRSVVKYGLVWYDMVW